MFKLDSDLDFEKTRRYLTKLQNGSAFSDLEAYGQMGVDALEAATPVDTRLTANSWSYRVTRRKNWKTIAWYNNNTVDGIPVVILIQYGHGTRGGTWVEGQDFINPAIQPVFDKIVADVWKKVKSP